MADLKTLLSAFSEVVDVNRRWMPDWYRWFSELVTFLRELADDVAALMGVTTFHYPSRAAAEAATIPTTAELVVVGGYYFPGDGGQALYVPTVSDPGHAGSFQDASGAWFVLARQKLNVLMFGTGGVGEVDVSTQFQDAIDAVTLIHPSGGGVLEVPEGFYIAHDLLIDATSGVVSLHATGPGGATIYGGDIGARILTVDNGWVEIKGIFFVGDGVSGEDPGTFSTSNSTIYYDTGAIFCTTEHCVVWGGKHALEVYGGDNTFFDVDAGYCFGSAVVYSKAAANFYIRCKFDQQFPQGLVSSFASSVPAARANAMMYSVGTIVSFSGFYWLATVAGMSGGSTPAAKNYNIDVADGATLKWQLVCPNTFHSVHLDSDCNENQLFQVDMTGAFTSCLALTNAAGGANGPQHTKLSQCIAGGSLNGAYDLIDGNDASFSDCEMAAGSDVTAGFGIKFGTGWDGSVSVNGTRIFGVSKYGIRIESGNGIVITGGTRVLGTFDIGISVAANVSDFNITNNTVQGTTDGIQIAAGTSDRYNVFGNILNGSSATDNAAGANAFFGLNF